MDRFPDVKSFLLDISTSRMSEKCVDLYGTSDHSMK